MNYQLSKRTLIRILLIVTLLYLFLQIIICFAGDRNLSMSFWLEHHNAKNLVESGVPEKSGYTYIVNIISDYHFWVLRIGVLVTLFYAFYYKNKDKELFRLLIDIVISAVIILLISSGLITWILKTSIGKPRPYTLLESYSHFSFSVKYHSFPSGHTTETFSYIVPYIYFFRKYYISFVLLLFGFLVSFARIVLAQHYFTDVLFGAYTTIIAGLIVCYFIEQRGIRNTKT
jgi:membrane-associated phospholipid phosphatase